MAREIFAAMDHSSKGYLVKRMAISYSYIHLLRFFKKKKKHFMTCIFKMKCAKNNHGDVISVPDMLFFFCFLLDGDVI